jgi:hypothetical protein
MKAKRLNRRKFLNKVGAGFVLAAGASLYLPGVRRVLLPEDFWQQTHDNAWLLKKTQPFFAASSIVSRIGPDSVEDKRISLSNSNFARPLPIASADWTNLRIAVRYWFGNNGGNLTSNPIYLAVGLNSGTSNIFLDATTTNWIGFMPYPAAASWTYSAATNYSPTGGGTYAATRIGSTLSSANTGSFYASRFPCKTTYDRELLLVNIAKGSPNYTVGAFGVTSIGDYTDVVSSVFISTATTASPSLSGYGTAGVAIAFSESVNALDNVNIAWNQSVVACEISDLAIVKLA